MAKVRINNCDIHYEIYGNGPEAVVLSHGLLWSSRMFHKQVTALSADYKIVTYDHRGQGQSEITESGYDMDSLYNDAVGLIEKLNLGKVHFGGLSMGGFVAMRLAARRPDLIKSLLLMETSAQGEPFAFKYNLLKTVVNAFGVRIVTNPIMKIMFSDTFLNDPKRTTEKQEWMAELQKNKKSITKAVTGVIQRKGMEDELQNITCPTLVLVGTEDKATIPEKAEFIASKISQAKLIYIQNGGHTSSVEEPEQYNRAILEFLGGV
ncbi:MAG: 3-oxoadipate enol-lactonase [Spirosomataceae bacterium]|jgi:pimeloyl-ACP methyl ester carboxylesterase